MHIFKWKTLSDFATLIKLLHENKEEFTVCIAKNVTIGWYHVRILSALYPVHRCSIITKDIRIRKLFKNSGFRVYKSIGKMDTYLPEGYQIIQENLSWLDYIYFHIQNFCNHFFIMGKKMRPQTNLFSIQHSSWYILVVGIIIILLLSIGIISLTTPHASVTIIPQASFKKSTKNIVFYPEDEIGDQKGVPVRRNIFQYEFQKKYTVNDYDPLSLKRAKGTIKIENYGTNKIVFRPQTRFALDKILFRSEEWIEIPGTIDSRPTVGTYTVIADPIDTQGNFIGKRGNIPENTPLTIPALSKDLQNSIKVITTNNFSGGENTYKKMFTKEEKSRIEKIFREEFFESAAQSLKQKIKKNDEYIPLQLSEAIEVMNMSADFDRELGSSVDFVTVRGKGDFMNYLYNVYTLRQILINTAKNQLLESTETLLDLPEITPDIIAVLEKNNDPWRLKVTAQIPVKILYNFTSFIGGKNLKNILGKLLNTDIEKVQKSLLNDSYIKEVDIRVTPFWKDNLPNDINNIYIKIEKPQT